MDHRKKTEEVLPDLDNLVFQELDEEDLREISTGIAHRTSIPICC